MTILTSLVCFLAGFMFCEGNPVAPVARDLAHPPITTSHSSSTTTISGSYTSPSTVTVYHSCKSHSKSSHTESAKSKPTAVYETSGSVNSALVTLQVTTVTTIRTVHAPHSTRSMHRSHKASSSHKSHSVHSTHGSHTTRPHQTGSPIHTIRVTQTVTYQASSISSIKPSTTTKKDGVATSSHTSSTQSSHSSSSTHGTIASYGSGSSSSSSTSKVPIPTYTISPVLQPSTRTSSSKSITHLTSSTQPSSIHSSSSSDITTHLKSTVHITSVITVAPSSVHTTSTSTAQPSYPVALVRAVGSSSSSKAKAKDVLRAAVAVTFAALAAGLAAGKTWDCKLAHYKY